jgi:hypothetical protein
VTGGQSVSHSWYRAQSGSAEIILLSVGIICIYMLLNVCIYSIYKALSVQAQYSRSCFIISSSCYNSSLFTSTVVWFTASKYKPFIFPVSRFVLSNVANIYIFMILYILLLMPSQYCYISIYMEGWKPRASREPMCVLEDYQWNGELCSAGAGIRVDACLLQTPRRGKHKSWYS